MAYREFYAEFHIDWTALFHTPTRAALPNAVEPNSVVNGDCLEVMKRIPAGSVDMVLCDLPYGTTQNKWDSVIPFAELWPLLRRVCRPGAAIVLTAHQPFTSAVVNSNVSMFRHEWIWKKPFGTNFLNAKREPMKEHESVLVFCDRVQTYNPQKEERLGNAKKHIGKIEKSDQNSSNYGAINVRERAPRPELRYPGTVQAFNLERGLHPTQKPVALFEYMIRTYSNPGEVVLDCCAGSGTTAIAAINAGRRYICIEQDTGYYDTIQKRIANRLAV